MSGGSDVGSGGACSLILEDASLIGGWIALPYVIATARRISPTAKLLWSVLIWHGGRDGRIFPGYNRMCDEMGVSENSLRRAMRELIAVGLVSQVRRGRGMTNQYRMHRVGQSMIEYPDPRSMATHDVRTSESDVQEPKNLMFKNRKIGGFRTAKSDAKTDSVETDSVETHEPAGAPIDPSHAYLVPILRPLMDSYPNRWRPAPRFWERVHEYASDPDLGIDLAVEVDDMQMYLADHIAKYKNVPLFVLNSLKRTAMHIRAAQRFQPSSRAGRRNGREQTVLPHGASDADWRAKYGATADRNEEMRRKGLRMIRQAWEETPRLKSQARARWSDPERSFDDYAAEVEAS